MAWSVVLAMLALAALACSALSVVPSGGPGLSPLPVATLEAIGLPTEVLTPTLTPVPTVVPLVVTEAPTVEVPVLPTEPATAVPPTEQPTATSGPQTIVITDADLQKAIESGVLGGSGVNATNLQIRFTGGKVRITADHIAYGFFQADNLVYVGRLSAQNGVMQVEAESVSPGGVIAAVLPTVVNQALSQYASNWYVEQVRTSEGQIELVVR